MDINCLFVDCAENLSIGLGRDVLVWQQVHSLHDNSANQFQLFFMGPFQKG